MAAAPKMNGEGATATPMTTTPAQKYAGLGAALKHGDGATPEVFTTVPSVKTLGGPKTDSTQIDTTTLDTLGGYETFVMGLLKPGTLDFELVWDPADITHKAIRADYAARTLRNWQIIWPDVAPTKFAFAAYVKSWESAAAPNTDMTMKMSLQISGPITETSGP